MAGELTRQCRQISADMMGDVLRAEGLRKKGNEKKIEGKRQEEREDKLRYNKEKVKEKEDKEEKVIREDKKKKELVGQFANKGREWRNGGQTVKVNRQDYKKDSEGREER